MAAKKKDNKLFSLPLFFVGFGISDPGSGIRDPGWKKIWTRDLESRINIPEPQHWLRRVKVE
jgi:hypothetical protein